MLFHGALGLRRGVLADAERLRGAGHLVHTPDLFGGDVFDDMGQATAHRDAVGVPELIRRATEAVAALPEGLVFAGYSMGAAAAQVLAATRPGARAAVLLHGALPLAATGGSWSSGVPVALHHGEADPLLDAPAIDRLVAELRAHNVEVERFTYPAAGHLFTHPDLPDYHAPSADLLWRRVTSFLGGVRSGA